MSSSEFRGHSSNGCGQHVAAISSTVTPILQCRQCQVNTEERKRPKDSACILNTADMFDLLSGHYRQENACNIAYVA